MQRRDFFGALALGLGGVFAPKFGRWHKQGSGLLVRAPEPVYWGRDGAYLQFHVTREMLEDDIYETWIRRPRDVTVAWQHAETRRFDALFSPA